MLKNYFLVGLRRLAKNRTYTFLNIFGLAISVAAFLVMALYIESELSYDTFHINAERIVRVTNLKQTPEAAFHRATTAAPIGPSMKEDFEEIERFARLMKAEAFLKHNDISNRETNLVYADPDVFNVFSFQWLKGDAENALTKPFTIVITEETAIRYFQNEDPIGKELIVDEEQKFFVTGVVKSFPENSHLTCDAFLSMSTAEQDPGYNWLFDNWYSEQFYTYLLLKDTNDDKKLASKFGEFAVRHQQPNDDTRYTFFVEKLTDIYLKSEFEDQFGKTGSYTNVYSFAVIAFFIIIIASINFVNLTTAQSSERAKEIGVRKVTGATLAQLRGQFMCESFLIMVTSIVIAISVCQLILPFFNQFANKRLSLSLFESSYLVFVFFFVLAVSLLAGFYPAFVMSNLLPALALKGMQRPASTGLRVRESLVVLQFTLATLLIVCCLVVYNQLRYVTNFDVGFNRDQTLILNTYGENEVRNHLEAFKTELGKVDGVKKVSVSSRVPGEGKSGWSMEFNNKGQIIKTEMPLFLVDHDFLDVYGIPIVTGRGLSRDFPADTIESMMLSESAVRALGFAKAEDAIGVVVDLYPSKATIVGVFKDFNFESLHSKIEPLAMRMFTRQFSKVSVKINSSDIKSTVDAIEEKWKQLIPGKPVEYSFLDDDFNNYYKSELKFGQVFLAFTILAVIIACLGLYGLSLISTLQRKKEIGIRKIIGASTSQLIVLLASDYLKLVVTSFFIALPISYFLTDQWLSSFSYRVEIKGWIYLTAVLISAGLAMVTVFSQTFKAAVSNSIDSISRD